MPSSPAPRWTRWPGSAAWWLFRSPPTSRSGGRAAGAADIVVLKAAPLGGVHAALAVAAACGLPVVVSSAVESSVGLAAGVALAAGLPELPDARGVATVSL